MPWRRHNRCIWAPAALALFASAGCTQKEKLTLAEVERLLHESSSHRFVVAHFTCEEGEGDFEYICQARFEPTALSKDKPSRQRVGVRIGGYYKDRPLLVQSALPDGNSVPSLEELSAPRQREAAAAAEKSRQRTAESLR
jgi:hypothetical protein